MKIPSQIIVGCGYPTDVIIPLFRCQMACGSSSSLAKGETVETKLLKLVLFIAGDIGAINRQRMDVQSARFDGHIER